MTLEEKVSVPYRGMFSELRPQNADRERYCPFPSPIGECFLNWRRLGCLDYYW